MTYRTTGSGKINHRAKPGVSKDRDAPKVETPPARPAGEDARPADKQD